jgi:hypothetical protein
MAFLLPKAVCLQLSAVSFDENWNKSAMAPARD